MPQIIEENNGPVVLIDAPPYLNIAQEIITVVTGESVTVIDGAAQGQRGLVGPQGPAGTPRIEVPFSFGDATPATLFTAKAGKLIQRITVFIERAFDGLTPVLTIGDATEPTALMGASENDPTDEAVYQVTPNLYYETDTEILLFITPGLGASQGSGLVVAEVQT